jgi:hypothetical protein
METMFHNLQPSRKFCDIFPDVATFVDGYTGSKLATINTVSNPELVYYLLYARYANWYILPIDENQWKYKVYSMMFQYGPTWEKRLDMQRRIRELTEDEIRRGSKRIDNLSYNPSTSPSNDSMEPLDTINQQHFNGWEKSPLEGYANLEMLLETDVSEEFISKFKKLFTRVQRAHTVLYETEGDLV